MHSIDLAPTFEYQNKNMRYAVIMAGGIANRYIKSPVDSALPLTHVPIVGDSLRDLLAGTALGASPHLVLTGKGQGVKKAELS